MTIKPYTRWIRYALVWSMLVASATLSSTSYAADGAKPVPQLIYMVNHGIDLAHNPIDRLIDLFTTPCNARISKSRPCRIELEMVAYLQSLPRDLVSIAHELSAYGADCKTRDHRLTCRYALRYSTAG